MRFIVSTSTLLKQLQSVSGALSNSTVLPILENFLFEIKDGTLTISATDLQTSMTTSLTVEAKENGRIAIPSRILLDTLKSLPEQPIAFNIDDNTFAIEINAGDGKYKLSGENGEDFPKIPVVENASSVTLNVETTPLFNPSTLILGETAPTELSNSKLTIRETLFSKSH